MRNATIERNTAETRISLFLELDGSGRSEISTGCGFLDHMLTLFASHGRFDLKLSCKGDTNVDYHHTTEDVGICLGTAFSQALGDKAGINRYGYAVSPMDEALVMTALDFSGRGGYYPDTAIPTQKVGDFDTELVDEFFFAFARTAQATLHIRQICGGNSHHIIEGMFKSFARAARQAVAADPELKGEIPSTKGVI